MSLVTIGLKQLLFAPLAADGGPGTVFTALGFTGKGTFQFQEEDPSKKTVDVEEKSAPLKVFKKAGARSLIFNIPDPDVDALAKIRGGTVTTATGKKTYAEDDPISLEGTIQVVPEEGFDSIQYNHVSIFGKMNGGLGAEQELVLGITVDILAPSKTGVKVMEIIQTVPAA